MAATADFDPDQPVIEAIQRGDHGAFRELLRREDRWVRGVVFSVLGDRQRVDDVTQQVWTAVWERMSELREADRWRPWLYRLARNAAVDAGRESTRRKQLSEHYHAEMRADQSAAPADDIARKERLQAVHRAIEELPPRYREVLTLRHLEGWSYRQIAEVLDVPIDTVETRLVRARRKLREVLEGWLQIMTRVSEHIERLIGRRLDGEITAEENAELDREVLRDPEVRALLESYAAIDELAAVVIRESAERSRPRLVVPAASVTPPAALQRRMSGGRWMVAASALAACLALIIFLKTPEVRTPGSVASKSPGAAAGRNPLVPPVAVRPVGDAGVWGPSELPTARIDRTTDHNVLMLTDELGNTYLLNVDLVRELERDASSTPLRYASDPI